GRSETALSGRWAPEEELGGEAWRRARLDRLAPGAERAPACARDRVELLVGPGRLDDDAAPGKPRALEPRQDRIQTAPRRRPHMADRLPDELEQVIARPLPLDREQREHGRLRRR